jgi:hypothetical protein
MQIVMAFVASMCNRKGSLKLGVQHTYYVKRQIFQKNFLNTGSAFYGLDTEPEPKLVKSRNQNLNRKK